jgi:hypothetical protein
MLAVVSCPYFRIRTAVPSDAGRLLWDQYVRFELVATMGSPTVCGMDHRFDMFQYGRSYLIVRSEQFDDIRLSLGFAAWEEAEETRALLLAMGL